MRKNTYGLIAGLLALFFLQGAFTPGQTAPAVQTISFPLMMLHGNGSPWTGLTSQDLPLTVNGKSARADLQQPWLDKASVSPANQINVLFVVSAPQLMLDTDHDADIGGHDDFEIASLKKIRKFVESHRDLGWNMAVLSANAEQTPYTKDTNGLIAAIQHMIETDKSKRIFQRGNWVGIYSHSLRNMRALPGRRWAISMGDTLSWRRFQGGYGVSLNGSVTSTNVYSTFPNLSLIYAARAGGVTMVACEVKAEAGAQFDAPGDYPLMAKKRVTGEGTNYIYAVHVVPFPPVMPVTQMYPWHSDGKAGLTGPLGRAPIQIVSYKRHLVSIYTQQMENIPSIVQTFSKAQYRFP